MEQEIYYQAEIQIDEYQDIKEIEQSLKKSFTHSKIIKVKGNYLKFELTSFYNAKFTKDEIESFIYNEIIKEIRFYELNVLSIKEEKENLECE